MDRVVTTDPRQWSVLQNTPGSRPTKRTRVQLWIRRSHIGIGDDIYAYLRRPRYVQILMQGDDVAIMPCGADDEGARAVHKPKSPRKFFHLFLWRTPASLRRGDYNNLRLRMVGGNPYVVFDVST